MKIVHLIDYFQPVLGYQEAFLAREQLRLGNEVTVVTSDRYAPFPDYMNTVYPLLGERIRAPGRFIEEGIPVWRLPVQFERRHRCWPKSRTGFWSTATPTPRWPGRWPLASYGCHSPTSRWDCAHSK
jgi:hypothetical protein